MMLAEAAVRPEGRLFFVILQGGLSKEENMTLKVTSTALPQDSPLRGPVDDGQGLWLQRWPLTCSIH